MTPMDQDRPFQHGMHIILMILTLGVWFPVWLSRWQMHKIDRVREAQDKLARQIEQMAEKRD